VSRIDYAQLRADLNAVHSDEAPNVLKKAGFLRVAVDPSMHEGKEPEPESQRIVWETLDTAWNLLRESATRLALLEVREQLTEQGFENMPTDEELFERAREEGEGATSYLDLAPDLGDSDVTDAAGQRLYGVLALLGDAALGQAMEGFEAAAAERH
jgi:hypothetical protein